MIELLCYDFNIAIANYKNQTTCQHHCVRDGSIKPTATKDGEDLERTVRPTTNGHA